MHIEVLVEDLSGKKLLDIILPQLLGPMGERNTWRVHSYKGIGRIPARLSTKGDPNKRILLDQLPRLLRGYGRTPGIDAVVIVVDSDRRDCIAFLKELNAVVESCEPAPRTMFRLAIEEIEAWYLGDRKALLSAYPRARHEILNRYIQDSVCDTWELLADAIYKGGVRAVKKTGWPLPGQIKSEWAETIGQYLDVEANESPSFRKLRDGLRNLIANQEL